MDFGNMRGGFRGDIDCYMVADIEEYMVKGNRLSVVEELLLLAVGDGGRLPADDELLSYGLVAGVLMELSLAGRIDTDLDRLMVLNLEPLGNGMLDRVLSELTRTDQAGDVRFWLKRLVRHGESTRNEAISSLVQKGIVDRRDRRVLGLFRSRRYVVIDEVARDCVKEKVLHVLRSGEIPEPRVSFLICLVDACGLLGGLVDRNELARLDERLEIIRRLELVGLVTSRAIDDIRSSLSVSVRSRR